MYFSVLVSLICLNNAIIQVIKCDVSQVGAYQCIESNIVSKVL